MEANLVLRSFEAKGLKASSCTKPCQSGRLVQMADLDAPPDMARVRRVWEQHPTLLPCTDCDCEVVQVLEAFWQSERGEQWIQTKRNADTGELVLDFGQLCDWTSNFVSDLGEMIQQQPSRLLLQLGVAVDISRGLRDGKPTVIRVERLTPLMPLSQLRASKVDRLVSILGTVTHVGSIKPMVLDVIFKCAKCGAEERRAFTDGKYEPPTGPCECKGRSFELVRSSARTVDLQQLKVQQRDEDDVGRVPRSIDVDLVGPSLVGTCVPGDVVQIAGIVRSVNADVAGGRHDKQALATSTYVLYLEANSLYNASRREDDDEKRAASSEDEERFQRFAANPDSLSILVSSLCPSIYGHLLPKLGLLLALVSESNESQDEQQGSGPPAKKKRKKTRDIVRTSTHVLIVGDPGMGKSQMLRAAAACAPRSVYVCGNTTTVTGLTATVSRDKKNGGAALEAGAVVLADRGAMCLDELDKMDTSQYVGLLEAMEQQRVSIAKCGVVAALSARTSVLAAANPIGGQYDRSRSLAQNLGKMTAPLLSRFDLIFLLVDNPDRITDNLLSRHVLGGFQRAAPTESSSSTAASSSYFLDGKLKETTQVVPRHFLRDYIGYAAATCKPALSAEAARILRAEYLRMRSDTNGIPVTMRQLESLVRLGKSRARLELRRLVTAADAADVVQLMRASLVQALQSSAHTNFYNGPSHFLAKGASDAKIVKTLVAALHDAADAKRNPYFTLKQIAEVANQACDFDSCSRKPIRDYIEILNDQNYLLYQRHPHDQKMFAYKLASSKFSSFES